MTTPAGGPGTPREVVVLLQGSVSSVHDGRYRATATISLITGDLLVLVDTGGPDQKAALLAALAERGVSPADIRFVINTHGHLDHMGNNNLFERATFVLDNDVARDGEYWTHDFQLGPLDLDSQEGVPPIRVQLSAGHTDHDLSVLVETRIGRIAIVGDLFEHEGDWADDSWRAWSRYPVLQAQNRALIAASSDFIVPGHGGLFRATRLPG